MPADNEELAIALEEEEKQVRGWRGGAEGRGEGEAVALFVDRHRRLLQ